ncbi:HalOD1 output domain-containing protein [Natrononativus amylolyticus]|uniref:HalOD1 output domain-containing protein n=1 Tax=Natrononativus amylolyticus TaxID=2963434 RepID=UPI0020CC05D3|nr:HalOD1 output domain-containing protein [Natrononativus amylolyticus]
MSRIAQHVCEETPLVRSSDGLIFDERAETYRLEYDPTVDDTSLAVVAAVAAASRTDPAALEPLHAAIDASALDTLFESAVAEDRREFAVSFTFSAFDVTVESSGTVEVKRRQCT